LISDLHPLISDLHPLISDPHPLISDLHPLISVQKGQNTGQIPDPRQPLPGALSRRSQIRRDEGRQTLLKPSRPLMKLF
jgi:hypothetical protein